MQILRKDIQNLDVDNHQTVQRYTETQIKVKEYAYDKDKGIQM
jgi:hypothetical protein